MAGDHRVYATLLARGIDIQLVHITALLIARLASRVLRSRFHARRVLGGAVDCLREFPRALIQSVEGDQEELAEGLRSLAQHDGHCRERLRRGHAYPIFNSQYDLACRETAVHAS